MSNKLKGLTFVVTGILEGFTRNGIGEFITANGGVISETVNKKTDYLIVGDKPGASKLNKAQQFGTKIIDLEKLDRMLD